MKTSYAYDIIFVILNYNIVKETIDCVHSIEKNIDTDKYHIIVVDNGSSNQAGDQIFNHLKGDRNCSVLLEKKNLGFACGNNKGIMAARTLKPEFICCLNNDTLLESHRFYRDLNKIYEKKHPALIGPKIILKDGSINISDPVLHDTAVYEKALDDYKAKLNGSESYSKTSSGLKSRLLQNHFINRLNALKNKAIYFKRSMYFRFMHEDVVLHGCCLIFTPEFFRQLSGFNPDTFLFREEELLYIDVMDHNMHTLYDPYVAIRHLEDASTNASHKDKSERNTFMNQMQQSSLEILIKKMKQRDGKCHAEI